MRAIPKNRVHVLAVACAALLVLGSASAQRGPGYAHGRDHASFARHGHGHGYDRGHYGHGRGQQYRHHARRGSDRDAGLALGALVVGGILGYALSQSSAPPSQAGSYYAPPPPLGYQSDDGYEYGYSGPAYSQAQPGYVAPPVQVQPHYQPASVQTAPVYWQQPQPAYSHDQAPVQAQYEYRTVHGRTYYRPVTQ